MDHQLQLIEQAVAQKRTDQRAASGDYDVPALPLLELRYLISNVLADERGVLPPKRLLEGPRDDVLLHSVHLSGHRILLRILPRPEGGPFLVVHPTHQHGVCGGKALPYRLAHLVIEVGEVPLIGGLHHAVQRQKLRSNHFPHLDLLLLRLLSRLSLAYSPASQVANFVELRKGEVRRTPLLGSRVNKGKRKEGSLAIMVISYIYMGYYNTTS